MYTNQSVDGFTLPLAADLAKGETLNEVQDFGASMRLKPAQALLPLIVLPTGYIYIDTNNPFGKAAEDFLVTIAEPVSRPENIHEFQITVFSLYAAVGVGLSVDDILRNLEKFSKNVVPDRLQQLLRAHGNSFGRVKLVLRDGRYFLEAGSREDLEYMLSNKTVANARIRNSLATRQVRQRDVASKPAAPEDTSTAATATEDPSSKAGLLSAAAPILDPKALGFKLTDASQESLSTSVHQGPSKLVYLFELLPDRIGKVKEAALTELHRPLVFEYDFRRDASPSLDIALRPATKIRYYQERALRKMFSNGRARSGIIVLPCGAGKTLTGITAATTIRKSVMILTSSSVAVDQWKRSFIDFTTVDPNTVITLTTYGEPTDVLVHLQSDKKSDLPEGACVLCSTYTMMSYSGKRSDAAERILQQIRQREWGILIFDEVQFAPAPAFRKINDLVKSHCKLGLTATLVREDDLIHDLQWLIGPKLYEANWLELQEAGFLAKVQVSEVWCPMTADFYKEYLVSPHAKQRKLWVCNPNKLRVCEYLLRFHEARRDKVIVFSDNLFALKEVAFTLKKPFISGEVGMQERLLIINRFKVMFVYSPLSFNFASRRQEAQRLGRILRPKPKANEEFNAFFYSLVSKDTQEMLYADKRQQFIIDQGYAYKVLPISVFPMENETLIYDDPAKQRELLRKIQTSSDTRMDLEEDDVVLNDSSLDISQMTAENEAPSARQPNFATQKVKTSLSSISGGKPVHPFFRRR